MIPVLRIRDANGNVQRIAAIRGEKGEAGSVTSVNGVAPDENGNVVLEIVATIQPLIIGNVTFDGTEKTDISEAIVEVVRNALPTWTGGDY